jgi:hypothetical protein
MGDILLLIRIIASLVSETILRGSYGLDYPNLAPSVALCSLEVVRTGSQATNVFLHRQAVNSGLFWGMTFVGLLNSAAHQILLRTD